MAIIKNLAFYQKSKLKHLTTFVGGDAFMSDFLPYPLDFINHVLPLKLKFYQEAFVALEKNKVMGLIALEKEAGNPTKLKITKLFLEENSYEIGEQLINYVISRYRAYGASAFVVRFAQELEHMASLFIDACKFRVASYEFLYKIENNSIKETKIKKISSRCFKNLKKCQSKEVADLHNECINTHLRPVFEKCAPYFKESFSNSIGGKSSFKYVFEDENKKSIYGYFSINTVDDKNFILDGILNPSFDAYFMDIVHFATQQISKRNRNWNLYIRIKNYFMNAKDIIQQLEANGFELINKNLILVKDSLLPIKQEGKLINGKLIFNDITPAFK